MARWRSSPARQKWEHSYVVDNKTFCIYLAQDEAAVKGARQAERLSGNEGDRGAYDHRPADREWLNITMPPRDRGGVSPWVRGR